MDDDSNFHQLVMDPFIDLNEMVEEVFDLEGDYTDNELLQPLDVGLIADEPHEVFSDEEIVDELETFDVPKAPEVGMIFDTTEDVKVAFHRYAKLWDQSAFD
ncbi:hypothetical protein Syun_025644 [Stephania yunnanensis]|uniref:Uncharacterized protein n=1 Tax=Stephania yunnanensis TaxID=152371 RepID=A0AAP0ESJ6_9MAGN